MWDFSDTWLTFDLSDFYWDGSGFDHGDCTIDLFDNLNGSVILAWGDSRPPADSYNVYVNGVLNQNVSVRHATVSGLQIASYNGATITPSLTYKIAVTAVKAGLEISYAERVVTSAPTSVMLTTPMKRILPFGNLPVN